MNDPVKYDRYKRKAKKMGLSSAYTAAVTEYMRKGKIECIDKSNVVKKKEIVVRSVKGRAAFKKVEVTFTELGGKELDKGLAISLGNGDWKYRYRGIPLAWENVIVDVKAIDVLGNVIMLEEQVAYSMVPVVYRSTGYTPYD